VSGIPFSLRLESSGPPRLPDGAERIGLGGLLARPGHRIHRAWVRGAAAGHGFRWNLHDTRDRVWWPQGIDVGEHDGRRLLAVSWFRRDAATRLSFIDLDRRRYHHVALIDESGPVKVHAGGIAWLGDRVLVADTFGGLRAFALDDIAATGARHVLPQSARYRTRKAKGDRGMRFSFVSIEHADGPPRLVAGEYGDGSRVDRAARFSLEGDGAGEVELHEPGLYRMQGIVIVDGVWYVTTSNGPRRGGDLWVGAPGAFTRHRHVLPPGPEDLAYDPRDRVIWSLSEWPGRRRVFQIRVSG
jgi:hypothetical protein